jgi:glycosyltransferase involved in cell wall biosynthesis
MSDYESAVERFGSSIQFKDREMVQSKCCQKFGMEKKSAPLLTIGIPIYNGFLSINRTLSSIYSGLQTIKNIDEVEIIIADNGSTDLTNTAVSNFFSDKCLRGAYYRHDENIGFDMNLDSIARFSTGKYVWFLGCGDEVKIDGIQRLLSKLQQLNCANLLLDFDRFSEADNVLIQKREYLNNTDEVIVGRDNFNQPRYSPALSGNVVKRQCWLDCVDDKFTASGWGHVERILKILSLDVRSETAILPGPFFTLFVDKKGWWTKPDGYRLHLEHIKIIKSMRFMQFNESCINKKLQNLNRIVLIRSVVGSRKHGYVFSNADLNEIKIYCDFAILVLIRIGLIIPMKMASFIFSENKSKAIWLGLRKLKNRFYKKFK